MIKKNDLFEAEITAMTAEGSGICRADGMAVFVPGIVKIDIDIGGFSPSPETITGDKFREFNIEFFACYQSQCFS